MLLEAEILNDLSNTFLMIGDPQMALTHLERCIQIFRSAHDNMRLSRALDTLGKAYCQIGLTDEAMTCLMESEHLAAASRNWYDVVRYKNSAGQLFLTRGDRDNAREFFEVGLHMAREFNFQAEAATALLSLAELEGYEGSLTEALPRLLEALKISEETQTALIEREACRQLSVIYRQLGDYALSLDYFQRFHDADKAIFNKEADQRLKNLRILNELDAAKKETELYHLRAEALQKEVEERRRDQAILERLADTDSLTGIKNRRAFFRIAEESFAAALENGSQLSTILIDVDNFKRVNDTHGHQVGDLILVLIAERFTNRIRSKDTLGRYGGEEFIVLLPDTDSESAFQTAERLRKAFSGSPVHVGEVTLSISLSIGVATLSPAAPLATLDQLIGLADHALYDAKGSGRDSTRVYSSH